MKQKYYVYGIDYYNEKGDEIIKREFYLDERERDIVFENGSSIIHPNYYPTKHGLFHTWRLPLHNKKEKKNYIAEEPIERKGTTKEEYKIIDITGGKYKQINLSPRWWN